MYQKLPFFAILGAVSTHFKATTVKFGKRMRTWNSFPQAKFGKNHLRGYTTFGQIYTKIPFLAIWELSPHFKSDVSKIWHKGTNLEHPLSRLIL